MEFEEKYHIVTFNEGLRMSNTGLSGGISFYQQEGHNLDPWFECKIFNISIILIVFNKTSLNTLQTSVTSS